MKIIVKSDNFFNNSKKGRSSLKEKQIQNRLCIDADRPHMVMPRMEIGFLELIIVKLTMIKKSSTNHNNSHT